MKLATRRNGKPDGELIVVSRDLRRAVAVPQIAATLQSALDDWTRLAPELDSASEALNRGELPDAFEFSAAACALSAAGLQNQAMTAIGFHPLF